ncbi:MAG: hypothetical protein PGN37_17570 [Mycobacterium kyogaense]|uniref:hypothetical protein n=1 Tax=Mycobacterium kyogaense TaxID=2212479 RepID=UPI002FF533AF
MVAPFLPDEVKHPVLTAAPIALDVFDRAPVPSAPTRLCTHAVAPSSELAAELEGAAEWLGVRVEEILLAALGRTFGRTRGDGAVAVAVSSAAVAPVHPVTLLCAAGLPMGPSEMLQGAHNSLLPGAGHPHSPAEISLTLDEAAADAAALQVRVGRLDGALQVEWTYDTARLDGYSVDEMAEQFGHALIEITSDAGAPL